MKKKSINMSKNHMYIVILILLIALQLTRIIYVFVVDKQGFHVDEIWSYGLANSQEPYLFQDADETKYRNMNQWISGKTLSEYICVEQDERFQYDNVFYNQSKDLHPPFYYLVLHTICSFFLDSFSPWYGFSINIICFILIQLLLYRIGNLVLKSKKAAILLCGCFGFTMGALNNTIFIRMYALLSLWCVLFFYLNCKMKMEQNATIAQYGALFLVELAGCLTHHHFLAYSFVVVLFECLYRLRKGKMKECLIYGGTMACSVLASVAIFPATIYHVFGPRYSGLESGNFSFSQQFKLSIKIFFDEFFSLPFYTGSYYGKEIMFAAICICGFVVVPVFILGRKTSMVKKWKKSLNTTGHKLYTLLKRIFHQDNASILELFFVVVFMIVVVSKQVSFLGMGELTDRYYFMIMPLAFLLILSVGQKIVSKRKQLGRLGVLVLVGLVVWNQIAGTSVYTFPNHVMGTGVDQIEENADVVVVLATQWKMTNFPPLLGTANKVFFTTPKRIEQDAAAIGKTEGNKYLLVWSGIASSREQKQFLETVKPLSDDSNVVAKNIVKYGGASSVKCVGKQFIMNDWYLIYKIR